VITGRSGESSSSDVFVGRAHALEELDAALDAAAAGRGRLVLVTGDPGIGKTRLVGELAVRARSQGILVLRGACWEGGGAPAYWPWAQVLRAWMRAAGASSLDDLGAGSADVAALLPELGGDAATATGEEDAEHDRLRLFDALTGALLRGAERQPMLIVLDDLHWADTSSVLALRFLAGELDHGRLLVVGAYRDLEVAHGHPLASAIGDLARLARRLPLSGLTRAEVARYIAITTGGEPEADVVGTVSRQTGGNPLFVRELVRLAWQEGSIDSLATIPSASKATPAGVREVIARRLRLLPADAQAVLEVASVAGEEFSLEVVGRIAGLDRRRVLRALVPAIDARLLAGDPGAPGHYGFAHALIRDVLYQGLSAERLAWLHGRAGEAIEELYGDAAEHLAAIASHYLRAVPLGGGERALRYAQRAGQRALAMLGWEEAAGYFEGALRVLDLEPAAADVDRRCDLQLSLGDARVRAGETEAARQAFLAAADLARASSDALRLTGAALGLGRASPIWGLDPELVQLLELARDSLGAHGDAPLRARVLARLAQAQYYLVADAVRDALSRDAIQIARASGDDGALADALTARRVLWGPGDLPGRAELAEELVAVARRTGDLDLEVRARSWRVVDLVETGDLGSARIEIRRQAGLAARLRQPSHIRDGVVWRSMEALLGGRLEDAEAFAEEALAIGERIEDPGARAIYGVQKVMVLVEQAVPERLEEAVTLAREGSAAHPDIPAWRALLAFAEARAGRLEHARADLERAAGDGFADVPRDAVFLVTLTHSADAAAITGHREVAASLRHLLGPYGDRWVVIDRGLACKGSTQRLIGLLDGVLGDLESSVEHLHRALAWHVRVGARALAARNRRELASALLARRTTGDAERAASLLEEAEADARRLGMPGLLAEIALARSGSAPPAAAPDDLNLFRREGEFWTLSFAGRTVRVRDTKGLRDLAALLAHPGRETHALDLMGAAGTPASDARGGDIELIDPKARRAYRARLEELRQELDAAEADNDLERVTRARAETEFLTAELSAALGLRGRPRRQPDAPERARKAVTWRIHAGIDRIEREHAELGRHLRHAIRTGTFCSYAPEHPLAWRVEGIA
jgi:AAA ATPase domain